MVVLRGDDDQSICLAHLGGKVGVLNGLSRIVSGQWKLYDIDEVGLDARALTQFPGYKASCVQAHTRSEEHTSELQSRGHLVCRLLLEKKKSPEKIYAEFFNIFSSRRTSSVVCTNYFRTESTI